MIVASIKNGFQPHQVGLMGLFGLGCGDCEGSCGGSMTGPPIGPASSHVHEVMEGLGWTGTCANPTILMDSPSVRNAADTAAYVQACYPTASPVLTKANAVVDSNGNVVTPVVGVPETIVSPVIPASSIVAPVSSPVAQTVQQQNQSTGIVSTPVVGSDFISTLENDYSNSGIGSFLNSTFLGIPVWLIGGGILAVVLMEEN